MHWLSRKPLGQLLFAILGLLLPGQVASWSQSLEPDWIEAADADSRIADQTEANRDPEPSPSLPGLPLDLPEPPPAGDLQLAGFCVPESAPCCPPLKQFPTLKVNGFFQADIGWVHQDTANVLAVGDVQDGADFRRARLSASGNAAENVGYFMEYDFGFPGRPSFMDVWLELQQLRTIQNLRIGYYRQPFGLDGLTSVKDLTFLERSLPFAFLPFRQIGAMAYGTSDREDLTWAVSGFRFPTDFYAGQVGDNGGYGMATRITAVLIDWGKRGVLHVGGGYSVIDPANDAVRYLTPPEFFTSETGGAAFVSPGSLSAVPPFVDTGIIPTDIVNLFEAELATTRGPLHAQSEVIFVAVDRNGGPTAAFSGMHVQAGYVLTGEHRTYNRKAGTLGRVVPDRPWGDRGCGAWEVAARWSYIELNDADIRGGRLNDVTLGLNWYLNRHTKFQFNYIRAMLNSEFIGDSDANIVAARAQVDF